MENGITMLIGDYVRRSIPSILDYCMNNSDELERLMTKAHCSAEFKLGGYAFFVRETEDFLCSNMRKRYWSSTYEVQGMKLRACSQWTRRHWSPFESYLSSKGLVPTDRVEVRSPPTPERAVASTKARFGACAIGDAQNLFIRFILSNIGDEGITRADIEETKRYFGHKCAYCHEPAILEIDHGIPINKMKLGEHRLGNLIPSCNACNREKHNRDYKEFLLSKNDGMEKVEFIERYMLSRGYVPFADTKVLAEILDTAHKEVRLLAERYTHLIEVTGVTSQGA